MDPNKILTDLASAIIDADHQQVSILAQTLTTWLIKGGIVSRISSTDLQILLQYINDYAQLQS
jgi:uncharacterized membrane protein YhfC